MMYRVIQDFKDLKDNGYEYKKGDIYPHEGVADIDRVKHLMQPTPMRGGLLVKAEEEKPAEEVKPKAKTAKKK